MKECSECENCYPDAVNFCPFDRTQTRLTLPGGQLIANRYFLEKRIGRGAMGQVYLANDRNLRTRKVAVKTIRQDVLSSDSLDKGEAIAMFEREALAAAAIHHPHIVDITDFGQTAEGVFYLAMEYVEGETLHRLLWREGTLPIRRAVKLLRQIADGVQAAHEAGILHRDLKPANIFIMNKGRLASDGFVKIGDFGLAKIVSQTADESSSNITVLSSGFVGTPEFMSPEQMQPELGVDFRTDIYALGTIAYMMLGGKTPFSGDLTQLVLQKIMNPAPPLSALRSDIPHSIEKVIMNALEIKPENRPASVDEWISKLEEAGENIEEEKSVGTSKLIVLAPVNAEVYVNDERKGSVGSSGRLVLSSVPAGKHILRISKPGEKDDERVIELREDSDEQVIHSQLKPFRNGGSESNGSQFNSEKANPSLMPAIVQCTNCQSKFAEGVKFCGRCGNHAFMQFNGIADESKKSCPRCSAKLPATSKFCGKCGFNLGLKQNVQSSRNLEIAANSTTANTKQKICSNCGANVWENTRFCGRCGNKLN